MPRYLGESTHRYAPPARFLLLALIAALAVTAMAPRPLLGAAQAQAASDSADEIIFWVGLEHVVSLTDTELDAFASMGVDAFMMSARHLRGLGGSQDWTSDRNADLSAPRYSNQRQVRDSRIVQRAAARGIDLYLGFYAVNYWNTSTPYRDWYDDSGWALVTDRISDLAEAANMLGFRGLAIDQELYPQAGGARTATWDWDYPGNSRPEAEVRNKAKQRGEQVMTAILDAFPGVEIGVYSFQQKDSWRAVVYDIHSGGARANIHDRRVDIDWWNGMTSVDGWRAIRQWNAVFYKTWHYGTKPTEQLRWENAMLWDVSHTAQVLSRRFDNWEYARSRYHSSPFSWINHGPKGGDNTFDRARPAPYVETQLTAMRKWGMGGSFANYHYGGGFHPAVYEPYADAIRAAGTAGQVDFERPVIEVTSTGPNIKGTATDDLAVWSVHWRDDRGGTGTAELTFRVTDGDPLDIRDWQMDWEFPRSELTQGATAVTVVAEDIKGKQSAPAVISLGAAASPPPAAASPPPVSATSRPRMRITGKPPRRLRVKPRRATVRFRFTRSQPAISFRCRLNQRRWRNCRSGVARYRIRAGPRWKAHRFRVAAVDRAGNANRKPARYRFRVRRR